MVKSEGKVGWELRVHAVLGLLKRLTSPRCALSRTCWTLMGALACSHSMDLHLSELGFSLVFCPSSRESNLYPFWGSIIPI